MARRESRTPREITFGDVAFRYTDDEVPFWARANTQNGRWHLASEGNRTQYLSTSPDASWADLIRNENLRSEPEVALVRMPLWVARIEESRIVDYSTFDLAEAAGFPPDALIDDDWDRCQAEGTRLRELGYRGVLAPSAALPGGLALTLFGARRAVDWEQDPLVASAIPAKVVTVGSPPVGLVDRVRFVGEEHGTYVEYAVARGRRESQR
jgi:RES domain-containing protein